MSSGSGLCLRSGGAGITGRRVLRAPYRPQCFPRCDPGGHTPHKHAPTRHNPGPPFPRVIRDAEQYMRTERAAVLPALSRRNRATLTTGSAAEPIVCASGVIGDYNIDRHLCGTAVDVDRTQHRAHCVCCMSGAVGSHAFVHIFVLATTASVSPVCKPVNIPQCVVADRLRTT